MLTETVDGVCLPGMMIADLEITQQVGHGDALLSAGAGRRAGSSAAATPPHRHLHRISVEMAGGESSRRRPIAGAARQAPTGDESAGCRTISGGGTRTSGARPRGLRSDEGLAGRVRKGSLMVYYRPLCCGLRRHLHLGGLRALFARWSEGADHSRRDRGHAVRRLHRTGLVLRDGRCCASRRDAPSDVA